MASSRIFLVDDLAWWLGRVSLNPAKHIDHFGTIILPSILLLLRAPFLFGSAGKRIFANTLKYSYCAKLAADNQLVRSSSPPSPTTQSRTNRDSQVSHRSRFECSISRTEAEFLVLDETRPRYTYKKTPAHRLELC
jgi:hypothetical protein